MTACEHCGVEDIGHLTGAGWVHTVKPDGAHVWWARVEEFAMGVTVIHDSIGPLYTWRVLYTPPPGAVRTSPVAPSGGCKSVLAGLIAAGDHARNLRDSIDRDEARVAKEKAGGPLKSLRDIMEKSKPYKSKF